MRPKDPQGCCRCRTHLSCPHHCRRHRFLERPQGRSGGRFRSGFPRARHLWASSARSLQGARCPLRSLACPVTRSKPRRVHMMYARACACMCVHAHACCSSTHTWDAKGVAGVFWSGDQAQPDDVDGDHPSEASDGDSSPCTHAIMRHESCTHNRQSVLQIGTQSTAIHPSVPASTELRNEVRGCESATKISAGPHRGAATCLKALRTVPQNSVFPKGSTQWCGSVRPGCSLRPRTREWLLLSAQWRPCAFVQGQGVQYGGVHGVLAYGQCCSRHRMPSWRTLYMQSRRAHDSTMSRSRTGSSM